MRRFNPLLIFIFFLFAMCHPAFADDVLWFGALDSASSTKPDAPRELHNVIALAETAIGSSVSVSDFKKRRIFPGMDGTWRLKNAEAFRLRAVVLQRDPSAYLVEIHIEDAVGPMLHATVRLARNDPIVIVLPQKTDIKTLSTRALFLLLR